jgi:hypothetical protein
MSCPWHATSLNAFPKMSTATKCAILNSSSLLSMFYYQVVFMKIGMRLQDFALTFHRLRSFGQPKSAQRSHQGKLLVATKTGALLSVGSLSWICVLIICCVACCLACSEFPETLSLTDDSSNDFMVVSEVCSAIRSEAVESRAVSQITIHPTTPTTRPLLICYAHAFPRQSQPGPDLLTLISLRRI